MGVFFCCLCCLTSQTANCLEFSLIIQNSLSLIFYIWAFAGIQWKLAKKGGIALFVITFIFLLYSIFTIIYFFFLRKLKKINTTKNSLVKILGYIMYIIDFLGLLFVLIAEIIVANGFNQKIKEVASTLKSGETTQNPVNKSSYLAMYIAVTSIEILWLINMLFWASDMILIRLRIDGPYDKYVREANNAANIQRQVQIVGPMGQQQMGVGGNGIMGGLVIVGYDENGDPLYGQPGVYIAPAGRTDIAGGTGSQEIINKRGGPGEEEMTGEKGQQHPLDFEMGIEGQGKVQVVNNPNDFSNDEGSTNIQGLGYGDVNNKKDNNL